jgi:NAD(P)-dependent dehydrogenase (short-subunit alcohol dehydrogenase family)
MTDTLVGRTALVTGASRGIGRAVAVALAAGGARVFGLARSIDALARLSSEHGITPIPADLGDDADVWTALDEMMDGAGGPPDIVVNAAGVFGVAALASETVRSFDDQLRVNTRGPFLVIRSLLPHMIERGSGIIVNVGSVAGRKAFPGDGAYSASKFGLRGLHEVLLEEVRGTGVRASLVEPAATDTELWDPLYPDADPSLPNRVDMLSPEDVSDAIIFVVTRPAGVTIPVLAVERG